MVEDVSKLAKELEKFSKEVLIYYILKHHWQIDEAEILHEMRYKTWEMRSKEDLKLMEKENAQTNKLAEKLKTMPRNTDEEILEYLKTKNRLFEMFRKHNKAQNKREEELDRLYKAIDGGE